MFIKIGNKIRIYTILLLYKNVVKREYIYIDSSAFLTTFSKEVSI